MVAFKNVEQTAGLANDNGSNAANIATFSTFSVDINPTTRVIVRGAFDNIPGSSSTYTGNYAAPQHGTISSYTVQTLASDLSGTVIGETSVTGSFPTLQALFNTVIYPADAVRSATSWSNLVPAALPVLQFGDANQFWFYNNSDASLGITKTVVFGSGFSYVNGIPVGGKASSIGEYSADGLNQYDLSNFTSINLAGGAPVTLTAEQVYAGLFESSLKTALFGTLFGGPIAVTQTGTNTLSDDPFADYLPYRIINGSDAAETITGTLNSDAIYGFAGSDILQGVAGNDFFYGGAGNDTIDGGSGFDTALYTGSRASYTITYNSDGSVTVRDNDAGSPDGTDKLVDVEYIGFTDQTIATGIGSNFSVFDTSNGGAADYHGDAYSGPVAGLSFQYIYSGTDSLNVTGRTPGEFIHTGSGFDAIDVSAAGGSNVLDGGTNSNFLVGGKSLSGADTFFVDDRGPPSDIWSTVGNFHAGDAATIFGITQNGFKTSWVDGQGAAGFTGVTLHVTAPGVPTASITLAGYNVADLSNGRLSQTFGVEPDGTTFLYIHGDR